MLPHNCVSHREAEEREKQQQEKEVERAMKSAAKFADLMGRLLEVHDGTEVIVRPNRHYVGVLRCDKQPNKWSRIRCHVPLTFGGAIEFDSLAVLEIRSEVGGVGSSSCTVNTVITVGPHAVKEI